ncbi:hypothetical protein MTO96_049703 [Rhipicephalus appendiculatus]
MPPSNSKRYILNVVDFATRFIAPAAVSSTSTGDVIKHLHNVFYTYGTPDHCLSDHGSAFESNEFKRFMRLHSVELHFTTAYHPEGNGLVERSNGTLLAVLRKICAIEPLSWPSKLQEATFAINTSINASTNFTPFELLYGYVPKVPLQQHRPSQQSALAERILDTTVQRSAAATNSEAAQNTRKERYDRSHRPHTFTVGDLVWVLFGILLLPFPGFFTVSGGASSQSDSTPKNACEPILTSFLLENNGRIPTLDSFKHLAWQPPSSTDTAGADALFKHHFDGLLVGRDIAADMSLPRLFVQVLFGILLLPFPGFFTVLFGILLLPFPGFFTVSGGASSQSDSTPKMRVNPY